MEDSPSDEVIRVWALENAINSTNRKARTQTVIKRAEQYYGFLTRNKATVHQISETKVKK